MEIVFNLPSADTPGYLKRQRRALALQQELAGDSSPEAIDKIVEFLLGYVNEPEDKAEARDLIMELPRARIEEVMTALVETQASPKSSGKPATGPAAT